VRIDSTAQRGLNTLRVDEKSMKRGRSLFGPFLPPRKPHRSPLQRGPSIT